LLLITLFIIIINIIVIIIIIIIIIMPTCSTDAHNTTQLSPFLQADYTFFGSTKINYSAWAAWYNTWLLNILTPKGGVFSFHFLRLVNSNSLFYDELRLALLA